MDHKKVAQQVIDAVGRDNMVDQVNGTQGSFDRGA